MVKMREKWWVERKDGGRRRKMERRIFFGGTLSFDRWMH